MTTFKFLRAGTVGRFSGIVWPAPSGASRTCSFAAVTAGCADGESGSEDERREQAAWLAERLGFTADPPV